ncbi:MAG: hypothetical protein KC421_27705 [Anaerolineales bacterium]|nr:hypothetical protein [Anaerolineales bacterium]
MNSWKYIIWVLLAKKILNYDEPSHFKFIDTLLWKSFVNSNFRFLRRFLNQNYGNIAPSFTEIIADRARQIRSLKVKDFEIGTDSQQDVSQRLSRSINIINHAIESRILSILPDKTNHFLLFDQLDLGWDETEESKRLIIGLILAARDVVREAKLANKQVRVVIFLRSDIYETLKFEDKNKIWLGDSVKLQWDEWRLKQLISKRIEASAGGAWENVFTGEKLGNLSQLRYIAEKTMLRPRDMIQFCTYAREIALRLDKNMIDNESIIEACQPFSDYMRREIQDECKASVPEIDRLLTVLKDIGAEKITKKQFVEHCKIKDIANGNVALGMLVKLSIIGVCRRFRTEYCYQVDHIDVSEKLEPTQELMVHPSLRHILGLVNPSGSQKD